ncbi:MAG: hypothetical protein AAFZ65_16880, partial [Planctomycetota bacterium]
VDPAGGQVLLAGQAAARGRLTREEDLAAGRVDVPARTLAIGATALGALYGAFMGLFAALRSDNASFLQLLSATLKVPLLFLLTLAVTYPSLYVVSALFDSKLGHRETLRLLLAATAVNLALLASFGPVTAFFTLSTDSYAFMVVLNVTFMAAAGFVGLGFLRKALHSIYAAESRREVVKTPPPGAPETSVVPVVYDDPPAAVRVFTLWTVIYGAVGAQMGWVLRPFISAPGLPFEWFRGERDSNFFRAFFEALGKVLT